MIPRAVHGVPLRLRRVSLISAAILALAFPAAMTAFTLPPTQTGVHVYDFAKIWQPGTIAQAESTIEAIRARTQAQIAVVSVPTGQSSVSTEQAGADALLIMNTWGVGRAGVDDGLVILFDMDNTLAHGQIYLYKGKGFVDKYLSQGESDAIVNDDMLPKAKDGNLDGALIAGLTAVDRAVQPDGNPDRGPTAILHAVVAGLIVAIGLVALGLFLRTWWLRGRDARVVLIDDSVLLPAPPPGLTPAMATVLRHDAVDAEAFTSALVDLGHRGLLTFQEEDGDSKKVDLVIPDPPLADPASEHARQRPLGDAERTLLASVEDAAPGGTLSSAMLRAGTGKKIQDAFKPAMGKAALASGWFKDDPTKLTGLWVGIAVGLGVAAALAFFFFVMDSSDSSDLIKSGTEYLAWPLLFVFLAGIAIGVMSRYLAARTAEGAQTLAMALAYRNTLRFEMKASDTIDTAVSKTTSRLPWITTPDELTVWAVALGLKHDVDRLIKDTFEAARQGNAGLWVPLWFTGSGGIGSVADVTSMLSSISTTAASSSGGGYGGGGGGGGGGSGGGF